MLNTGLRLERQINILQFKIATYSLQNHQFAKRYTWLAMDDEFTFQDKILYFQNHLSI